jgi:hypothetical protein
MAGKCGTRAGGPLEPFRDEVGQALRAQGYSESRVVHLLLLMAHLSRWLAERGSAAGDLTGEMVEQFFIVFRGRHRWCRSSRSLAPVLEPRTRRAAARRRSVITVHGAPPAACTRRTVRISLPTALAASPESVG